MGAYTAFFAVSSLLLIPRLVYYTTPVIMIKSYVDMQVSKYKVIFSLIYAVLLTGLIISVHNIISVDTVDTGKVTEPKPVEDIKPAKVSVTVDSKGSKKIYSVELKTNDSVMDLLEKIRITQGFVYDKTSYTYGDKVNNINGVLALEGMDWHVYLEDKDITLTLADKRLTDNASYIIKLGPTLNK